jgi:hypothetical protein
LAAGKPLRLELEFGPEYPEEWVLRVGPQLAGGGDIGAEAGVNAFAAATPDI